MKKSFAYASLDVNLIRKLAKKQDKKSNKWLDNKKIIKIEFEKFELVETINDQIEKLGFNIRKT